MAVILEKNRGFKKTSLITAFRRHSLPLQDGQQISHGSPIHRIREGTLMWITLRRAQNLNGAKNCLFGVTSLCALWTRAKRTDRAKSQQGCTNKSHRSTKSPGK